jgi:hypothetical protein
VEHPSNKRLTFNHWKPDTPRQLPRDQVRSELSDRETVMRLMWLTLMGAGAAPPRAVPPVPQVEVVSPGARKLTDTAEFLGRIEAFETVEIRVRVGGVIHEVTFHDGDQVKEGDGRARRASRRRAYALSRSCTLAGCTLTARSRPSVWTRMWPLHPVTFLPASYSRMGRAKSPLRAPLAILLLMGRRQRVPLVREDDPEGVARVASITSTAS